VAETIFHIKQCVPFLEKNPSQNHSMRLLTGLN